jgi:transcriptional regulator NrdR family protein
MKCLNCNAKTNVIETRVHNKWGLRRRRSCEECDSRFSTVEVPYEHLKINLGTVLKLAKLTKKKSLKKYC